MYLYAFFKQYSEHEDDYVLTILEIFINFNLQIVPATVMLKV